MNIFTRLRLAVVFVMAQDHLARHRPERAWPLLARLQTDAGFLPATHTVRVEVDLLSALAAYRLGDWNLCLFHARAAIERLRDATSKMKQANRNHYLYYAGGLLEWASWQLGGHQPDRVAATGVTFADLTFNGATKALSRLFPVEPSA